MFCTSQVIGWVDYLLNDKDLSLLDNLLHNSSF